MDLSLHTIYKYKLQTNNSHNTELNINDLMRHLAGVGVEWGTSWVIKHILEDELTAVDADEVFEESMRQCYPEETTVGWMKFDTVELMKSQDPISWRIARDEYIDSLEQDEEVISFDDGSTYYYCSEIENLSQTRVSMRLFFPRSQSHSPERGCPHL